MAREIDPRDTTRAAAYELWMKAPNPMVTFFKTLDVTSLVGGAGRRKLKFNMLLDYCIGKAAAEANVKRLWLTHYSQMIKEPCEYLRQTEKIFDNAVCGYDGLSVTLEFEE